MEVKLGKQPARPGAVKLALAAYVANFAALPQPPKSFSFARYLPTDSGMLGNDQYGCCVWAGADHETMLWNKIAGTNVAFDEANTLADYSSVTGFSPSNPDSDQGTDMELAAKYRRNTGVIDTVGNRHKIGAYVALKPGNVAEHLLAAWNFGLVGIGITVSDNQIDQFNAGKPWTGKLGSGQGGHYVPLIGVSPGTDANPGYLYVVTWGKVQALSQWFFAENNDESLAYLSTEMIDTGGRGPSGLDLASLRSDLAHL